MNAAVQKWLPTTWKGIAATLVFAVSASLIIWAVNEGNRRETLLSKECVYTLGNVIDHFWQTTGPHFSYHYRINDKVIRGSKGCNNVVDDDGFGCPAVGRKFLVKYSVADSSVSEIDLTKPVFDTLTPPPNGWTSPPF